MNTNTCLEVSELLKCEEKPKMILTSEIDKNNTREVIHIMCDNEQKSIKYMFHHLMIRNDEHCPICRRYYISLHSTLKDVLNYFSSIELENELDETDKHMLETGGPIWIDEWERRRNGDKYQIVEIKKNKIYNLRNYHINDYDQYYVNFDNFFDKDLNDNEYNDDSEDESENDDDENDDNDDNDNNNNNNDSDNDDNEENEGINYMLLHIHVNRNEWCPDNIVFNISFYESLAEAFNDGLIAMKKYTNIKKNKFKSLEPIWLSIEKNVGDHYQIVKLKRNKIIYLNRFCKQIRPKIWFKTNDNK
jgi:hypothetical protein